MSDKKDEERFQAELKKTGHMELTHEELRRIEKLRKISGQ